MAGEYWDQPRIAREFGVSIQTVQTAWRSATLTALTAHVAASGMAVEVRDALGGEFRPAAVTQKAWDEVRRQFGLRPMRLPKAALPLPDLMIGAHKPAWREETIRRWATETERVDAEGALRRAKPPGRPKGTVEVRPRQRRPQPLGEAMSARLADARPMAS